MTAPVLLIIAGPNGSGKTTITARLRADHWSEGVEYLNADDIAEQRFGGWNSPEAVVAAAQFVEQRREELLRTRQSIAFETVFSVQDKVDFLRRARDGGYFTRVFFIGTENPRINAARVADRVMRGGHTVPIEKIVSRYKRSHANLSAAIALADRVYVYDNSVDGADARLCARTERGALRKVYGPIPTWLVDVIASIGRHPEFVDLRSA